MDKTKIPVLAEDRGLGHGGGHPAVNHTHTVKDVVFLWDDKCQEGK